METKIKIKSISVCIGDKRAELTLEQARALRSALNKALGKPHKVVCIPSVWTYPPADLPTYTVTNTTNTNGEQSFIIDA